MWRRVFICALVVATLVDGNTHKKKSCTSLCYTNKFPPCGTWLSSDNSKESSGIYLLGEGSVNLTCTVNSMPKPTDIDWLYRPDFETEWKALRCSSTRNIVDCRFNEAGEHRVKSLCVLKTEKLTQSGSYRCAAKPDDVESSTDELATSADTVIKVFGIENITLIDHDLSYDRMGSVTVLTCANPKPDIMWINVRDNTAIQAGQTIGRLSALPLQAVSERDSTNRQGPADLKPYCWLAKLFISRVGINDTKFSITVSNQAHTKFQQLPLRVENVPRSSTHVRPALYLTIFASLLSIAFLGQQ
jgi:hypothetical protein